MSCPACGEDARAKGYRECRVQTLLGEVVYERAYYHCRHCKTGWFPTDEELGQEGRRSRGCREVISLAGVLQAFEEGSVDVLPRMAGLNVSASTVQRVTETTGDDIARQRAEGDALSPEGSWKWNRDAGGLQVA